MTPPELQPRTRRLAWRGALSQLGCGGSATTSPLQCRRRLLVLAAVAAAALTALAACTSEEDSSAQQDLTAKSRTEGPQAADRRRESRLRSIRDRLPLDGRQVFVLGLDGFDWDFVLPLVEAGRMPNLAQLLDAGTWGTMEPARPTLSPIIWTSIATGVGADVHGILDFVEIDPQSRQLIPVTGRSRRVPAVWNVASALGLRVDVVGWWATWPAERLSGAMVSDRLYYTLTHAVRREVFRQDPPGMVSPASRTERFARLRDRAVRETDWEEVRRYLAVSEGEFHRVSRAGRGMEDPVDGFRRILAATRTYLESGLELAKRSPDLLMVYLEGTDTVGHLLARYMPPPVVAGVSAEKATNFASAVSRYFEAVDRWIGRYLEALPLEEVTWVVVSDHGFKWGEGRPDETGHFDALTAALWHEDDAIYLLAGPGVVASGRVEGPASIYDVAPTVAAFLGVPGGARWRGVPLPGIEHPGLEPLDYARLLPPDSYRSEVSVAGPVDREFLDQLTALGYIGEDEGASVGAGDVARTGVAAGHGTGLGPRATRGALNNLGIVHLEENRYEEAERVLLEAIRRFPNYAMAYYNLRNVHMEQGRYDEADRYLWLAVDHSTTSPVERLEQAANDYDAVGELERAAALLEEAVRRFPEAEELWVHYLYDLGRLERCDEGLAVGRRAAERLPESTRVLTLYGMAAGCAGEDSEARQALERSLVLDPNQPTARNTLDSLP